MRAVYATTWSDGHFEITRKQVRPEDEESSRNHDYTRTDALTRYPDRVTRLIGVEYECVICDGYHGIWFNCSLDPAADAERSGR